MAKKKRSPIPSSVIAEVLFQAHHTCCICRTKGKDVQIHHVDRNPDNNKAANLAVVCLDCHSRVTGGRGLGQSYSPGEVRKYKRAWDKMVLDGRQIRRPQIRYKKELVSQIDFIICDVLARKKDSSRVEELLDILFQLHLWRGGAEIDAKIVEGLHHLALMSGLSYPRVAPLVAEKLWEMCFHFVGPDDVPMGKKDQKYVRECIEGLCTLAEFNCQFGHARRAMDSIAENSENFFEIALWYNRRNIADAVLRIYGKAIKGCYEGSKLEFAFGRNVLRKSLRKARTLLDEQRSQWTIQRGRIDALLKL
jgi:hypothetical protein